MDTKMNRIPIRGFTLIELMIVLVVIAILASIAYPSYTEQVRSSRRADAKAMLNEVAQWMERTMTESGSYDRAADGSAINTGSASIPAGMQNSPRGTANVFYNLSITAVTSTTFALQALPVGAQSTDRCGTLTLNNAGTKGQASGQTLDSCWNR